MATAHALSETIVIDPEDLEVQIKLLDGDGLTRWHRPLAGASEMLTACESPIDLREILDRRLETCEGEMCPECFAPGEIRRAADVNVRKLISVM